MAIAEKCVNAKRLIHHAVIKEQVIKLLCGLQAHNLCLDCALAKVESLHAFLARDVVLTLANQLQSANRRTRLLLRIIGKCFRFGKIISQV